MQGKKWKILFLIIGIFFIIIGGISTLKRLYYNETIGYYSHTETHSSRSRKEISLSYVIIYDFTVNDKELSLKSNKPYKEPKNTEDKILYNPDDPSQCVLASDYTYLNNFVLGIALILCYCALKDIQINTNDANENKKTAKRFGLVFTGFPIVIYLMLLIWYDFQIDLTMILILVFFLVVIGIGIYSLKSLNDSSK